MGGDDMTTDHTTLYRIFDAHDELLYVGIAGNPGRRFEQHAGDKPWWGEVTRVEVEHFPTRSAAVEAEREAILSERPLHNRQHMPVAGLGPEQIRAVCCACGYLIEPPGAGYLDVDVLEALDRRQQDASGLTRWGAWHTACQVDSASREPFVIELRDLTCREQLDWWTTEIRARYWGPYTNWDDHLDALTADRDGLLRPTRRLPAAPTAVLLP